MEQGSTSVAPPQQNSTLLYSCADSTITIHTHPYTSSHLPHPSTALAPVSKLLHARCCCCRPTLRHLGDQLALCCAVGCSQRRLRCWRCALGEGRQQEVAVERASQRAEQAHCAGLEGVQLQQARCCERLQASVDEHQQPAVDLLARCLLALGPLCVALAGQAAAADLQHAAAARHKEPNR